MNQPIIEAHNLAGHDDLQQCATQLWPPIFSDRDVNPCSSENLCSVHSDQQLFEAVNARASLAQHSSGQPTLALHYVVHSDARALRDNGHAGDAYFQEALTWLALRHGEENVVAARIVRGLTPPKMDVIAVPLVPAAGHGKKSKLENSNTPCQWRLSATPFLGAKALQRLQEDFILAVAGPFGFSHQNSSSDNARSNAELEPVFDLDAIPETDATEIDPLEILLAQIEQLKLECEWARDELQRAELAHSVHMGALTEQLALQRQENQHLADLLSCLSGAELAAVAKRKRQRDLDRKTAVMTKPEIIPPEQDEAATAPVLPQGADLDDWLD